jgi:THO complex subunit 2
VNQLIFVSFSLSRKYLIQLHSTPTDSNAADALVTAYHTLLSATLSLWLPKHSLAPSSFSAFVKSMWQALPSSSQDAPSPAATALGELLIDSMWSIDSQLDEAIADSKAAIAAQSETEEKEKEQVNGQPDESNAVQSRDAATKDKGTLQELVRLLLVRRSFRMSFLSTGHSCLYFFLTVILLFCMCRATAS